MGKQSIRKICPCPATPCYKKPGLGRPPVPLNKHNRFHHAVPSHMKSRTAHSGGGRGSKAKSPAFCNGRHMAKKAQIQ